MNNNTPYGKYVGALVLTLLLAACGGGGGSAGGATGTGTYTAASGVAQKGPLILGSSVTAQELDGNLSPTGKQYSYQVDSDLGTFSPTSTFGSQYISLSATGYYFDEVVNGISVSTVTLNGVSDLSADKVLNVNLLTSLSYQRIRNLVVNSHMTVAAARQQAEAEVLAALNIRGIGNYGSFGTLDLSKGTDGAKMLAAVSSLFVYGNSSGQLAAMIASFQSDIADNGVIDSLVTKAALLAAGKGLNPVTVAANLTSKYSSLGATYTATDISNWIDQTGDGVVGKLKFQVPDATQTSSFILPSYVDNSVVGSSISLTTGQLWVNGALATGSITIKTGDVISVSPPAGVFPNGVLTIYVMSGTTRIARVSFVSGLQSITVTPATISLPKGLTQQYVAMGTFTDNSTADITGSVAWSSDSPAVAGVNSASGLANGVAVGSATMVAISGAVVSNSATFNVTPAILQSIAVSPLFIKIGVGTTSPSTAIGTYSDASQVNLTSNVVWSSNTPSVAGVNSASGVVSGVSTGAATIIATSGGVVGSTILTVSTNFWTTAASLIAPRSAHTATLLPNGKLLVAGGASDNWLASAELYDPATNIWSAAASLSAARIAHTATLLSNGKVLVVGGATGSPLSSTYLVSTELYDPDTNLWKATANLATARVSHTATRLFNGKILVVGGGDASGARLASSELYDLTTNAWSPAAGLTTARFGHTATLLTNGKVLVVGGSGPLNTLASAELYDPAINTWSSAGSLAIERYGHTATLLASGKVLVTGGTATGNAALASAELYDPLTNTWSAVGNLSTARMLHTATSLPSGKVLVVGGGYNSALTSSGELFDPITNTWSVAVSSAIARANHTATLLPTGTVLVVGGTYFVSSFSFRYLIDTELYW